MRGRWRSGGGSGGEAVGEDDPSLVSDDRKETSDMKRQDFGE